MTEVARRRRRTARRAVVAMVVMGLLLGLVDLASFGPRSALVGLVAAVGPASLLVALVLWRDRYEPEPPRLLAITFCWGATVAAFLAVVINTTGMVLVGGFFGEEAGELYGVSISAPVVEEALKATALLLVLRLNRNEFNGIVDAVVYASMVGLGFAMVENVSYFAEGYDAGLLPGFVFVRGVLSPFLHPLCTAFTGIGLAFSLRKRRRYPFLLGLLGAMLLHAAWNITAGWDSFSFLYLRVFVPGFLLAWHFVRNAAAAEAATVHRHLAPELASGLLTAEEVACLASVSARQRAVRQATMARGSEGRRLARRLQHVAVELAFHRRQAEEVGVSPGDEEHMQQHLAELRAVRQLLGSAPTS